MPEDHAREAFSKYRRVWLRILAELVDYCDDLADSVRVAQEFYVEIDELKRAVTGFAYDPSELRLRTRTGETLAVPQPLETVPAGTFVIDARIEHLLDAFFGNEEFNRLHLAAVLRNSQRAIEYGNAALENYLYGKDSDVLRRHRFDPEA